MNLAQNIFNLPREKKCVIRRVERLLIKEINLKYDLVFNETCINEGLLPTYTNIRLHNPAARHEGITVNFRRDLIKRQINLKKEELKNIEKHLEDAWTKYREIQLDDELRTRIGAALDNSVAHTKNITKNKTSKKLSKLYGGLVILPEHKNGYINLSDHSLTETEKDILNLGLNCHLQGKFSKLDKKVELETLYNSLIKLQDKAKVTINDDLRDQLRAEGTKRRHYGKSNLLTREQRQTAKELRETPGLTIRRADKASIYVLLNTDDYISKLNNILNDRTKFIPITRDPTETLKTRVNKLITANSAGVDHLYIPSIVGTYSPGYMYGNVKTHKTNNPLRPIISQVTTPTYKVAKRINEIITPYIPSKYSLKSTDEFIDIIHSISPEGTLASLDVESLFTNVPVEDTIEIICNNVYSHETIAPPNIPKGILSQLLRACTMEVPFRSPDGKMYYQIQGVGMGSPLGPTFANFYMCNLENRILQQPELRPKTYCRYVDDIYVDVRDETHLVALRDAMENSSVLKFTYEVSNNNRLPFLDVMIDGQNNSYSTSVYRKSTDAGRCLNAKSECPDRYKMSVINAYVRRAYKNCSDWDAFHQEVTRFKQILVNNSYKNSMIDEVVKNYLYKMNNNNPATSNKETIKVFYRNQMNQAYKTDEKVLKDIICRNVKCCSDNDDLKLVIYYKNPKVSNLLMKNNPMQNQTPLKSNCLIYEFQCPREECLPLNIKYVGMTVTSLSRRLTMHLREGAPKKHMTDKHNETLTRDDLVTNTRILKQCSDPQRLQIYEALYIQEIRPLLNLQLTGTHKTLSLFNDPPRPLTLTRTPQDIPDQSETRELTSPDADQLERRFRRSTGEPPAHLPSLP